MASPSPPQAGYILGYILGCILGYILGAMSLQSHGKPVPASRSQGWSKRPLALADACEWYTEQSKDHQVSSFLYSDLLAISPTMQWNDEKIASTLLGHGGRPNPAKAKEEAKKERKAAAARAAASQA